nr:hypothetical protein CFP56_26147 [Quercus suber]
MPEEVGKDIGRKIRKVNEVDKRPLQVDQVKFLRGRVEMPIDKPLRRRGYVAIKEGGRSWVTFNYERLPTFYFIYGMLGHDGRYYVATPSERQCGEWLRAGGISRFGGEKAKVTSNKTWESMGSDDSRFKFQTMAEIPMKSVQSEGERNEGLNSSYSLASGNTLVAEMETDTSHQMVPNKLSRWDKFGDFGARYNARP